MQVEGDATLMRHDRPRRCGGNEYGLEVNWEATTTVSLWPASDRRNATLCGHVGRRKPVVVQMPIVDMRAVSLP